LFFLGQRIVIYTDYKNLTYKNFNTERVLRWRLLLEKFNPELIYIKGENTVVADALSRLNIQKTKPMEANLYTPANANLFGKDDEDIPITSYPLSYEVIDTAQKRDPALLAKVKKNSTGYSAKAFCGGGKERMLICRNDKIIVPKSLQKRVITWYHNTLCHPGINCTEETISQHLWWPNMRDEITDYVSRCPTCKKK